MRFDEASDYILKKLKNELPATLHYHNIDHTTSVVAACKQLAELENINENDTRLVLTAACYHDTGFLKNLDGHELISCEIARNTLPAYAYTEQEVNQICGMIMATQLPQSPKNHLEEILADADLDYLGRDDFFVWSNRLHLEWDALGKINGVENWDRLQINFLETHHYFTGTSLRLRLPKKAEHVNELKAKLKN
jgi:uncharacterized protein